jgi:RIO kinase 1
MNIMSKKAQNRLDHQEKRIERRDKMLNKDASNDRATLEEVFDKTTLMIVYDLLNSGYLDEVNGVVSAGKEARVYAGRTRDKQDIAVKIYLTSSAEFKRGMMKYIEGDQRFKNVKHDTRSLIAVWAQKEFRNLKEADEAKVRVPKPIIVKSNVLLMEFIGKDGVSAPLLREQAPENPERIYKMLLTYYKRLYQKAKLVHGDLSEYNVMIWKGYPVIFDMSQSVPTSHPLAKFMLERDLANLNRFFSKLGVNVLSNQEMYSKVVG